MKRPTVWMFLIAADEGRAHFNVLVCDDERNRAQSKAMQILEADGWTSAAVVKSGQFSDERAGELATAAHTARELGWSMIKYPTKVG